MQNIKIQKNKSQKAFTLVEALVAISILMIAIASPMSLAQKGLSTATQTKDQMIAAFLAQDAVEAVKNIRDQIAIRGTASSWLENTELDECICNKTNIAFCNMDAPIIRFCTIDTASPTWFTGSVSSILSSSNPTIKLKISYTQPDINGVKHFLKYDYLGLNGSEDSKFNRLIMIVKNPAGANTNEAIIKVRVSWTSPQGVQKIDIQDFIYNYSENL